MAASGHSDEDLKNPNLFPLLRSGKWASWGQTWGGSASRSQG